MNAGTALVLGFLGSLHCAGMCGPLALALPATGRSDRDFVAGRLAYNLGRILTYCTLGIVFGLLGKTLLLAGIQRWVSIALGVLLLIAMLTTRRFAAALPLLFLVERLKSRMAALLRQRTLASLLILGMLNGLLPCGLVYVAAGAALLSGGILPGAQFMLFFGLGTVPMMLVLGLSRKLFPVALRLKLLKAVPISMFALAALLILRGLSLGIPFVSPDLAGGNCCWGK